MAVWSSGMILASGARCPGLNSRSSPVGVEDPWICAPSRPHSSKELGTKNVCFENVWSRGRGNTKTSRPPPNFGRVVKASSSQATGVSSRGFETHRCRVFVCGPSARLCCKACWCLAPCFLKTLKLNWAARQVLLCAISSCTLECCLWLNLDSLVVTRHSCPRGSNALSIRSQGHQTRRLGRMNA